MSKARNLLLGGGAVVAAVLVGALAFHKFHPNPGASSPAAIQSTSSGAPATAPTAPATNPADAAAPAPAPAATAANVAGTIDLVDGEASIEGADHQTRVPEVGAKLYEGDTVATHGGAELHIATADGGFIAVRPDSSIRFSSYQANGDASDHSEINLIQGSLRSITGWIGKTFPQNYHITTASATIGIRGTDHEPAYFATDTADTPAGTYDRVHIGASTIKTQAGQIDVASGQVGFTAHNATTAPHVLKSVPHFFETPHKHDAVFVGKHAAVLATLEQKRSARQAAVHGTPPAAVPRPGAVHEAPAQHPAVAPHQLPEARTPERAMQRGEPARPSVTHPLEPARQPLARPGQPGAPQPANPARAQLPGNAAQPTAHPLVPQAVPGARPLPGQQAVTAARPGLPVPGPQPRAPIPQTAVRPGAPPAQAPKPATAAPAPAQRPATPPANGQNPPANPQQ